MKSLPEKESAFFIGSANEFGQIYTWLTSGRVLLSGDADGDSDGEPAEPKREGR
jgi:hypothetical protein